MLGLVDGLYPGTDSSKLSALAIGRSFIAVRSLAAVNFMPFWLGQVLGRVSSFPLLAS